MSEPQKVYPPPSDSGIDIQAIVDRAVAAALEEHRESIADRYREMRRLNSIVDQLRTELRASHELLAVLSHNRLAELARAQENGCATPSTRC
jgi:hypothetical protein